MHPDKKRYEFLRRSYVLFPEPKRVDNHARIGEKETLLENFSMLEGYWRQSNIYARQDMDMLHKDGDPII